METECTHEGCTRSKYSRGLCQYHYNWLKRKGLLPPLPREQWNIRGQRNTGPCSVAGCGKASVARGYCNAHHKRWIAYGDPNAGPGTGAPGKKRNTNPRESYINNGGYRLVRLGIGKYVMEHRLVMERFLGRPLTDQERVHHKDGNRLNNHISNLELWSHTHPSGQRVEDLVAWARDILSLYGDKF